MNGNATPAAASQGGLWRYDPPLEAQRFAIEEVLQAPRAWARLPPYAGLDAEVASQVLAEAGRFASEVLAPLNAVGDAAGCRYDAGRVGTPPGFREAYRAYVEGGWPALACDPAHGGQGLPQLLYIAMYEMLHAANHAWAMYPALAHGAYECLRHHGSADLQQRYLDRIASGEWLTTMCLTEAHAGSDLGLLRARAVPGPDGSVRVSGQKIFASGGEHDLTDNIIHLVLCRLPDAPSGSRGLSLALVPKRLPDGTDNSVHCDGIEHKMGIHGSATCTMRFEQATGWLVGQPHRGLAAMFVMMNAARLQVGMQGLGHLEMARQNAVRYARQREQMRAPVRPQGVETPADPIVHHPAVRRTLWTLEALAEGQRVLAYRTAHWLDESEHHPDAARRQVLRERVALLTPVVKAMLTEHGFTGASAALQVWGGHGYVRESRIEQVLRDSRIAMIYEGTNEIQAIDLLQRKVLDDGGARLAELLGHIESAADAWGADGVCAGLAQALRPLLDEARQATGALARADDREAAYRVAGDYLRAFGLVLLGWCWGDLAQAAARRPDDPASRRRLAAACFARDWLLPEATAAWQQVQRHARAVPPWPQD